MSPWIVRDRRIVHLDPLEPDWLEPSEAETVDAVCFLAALVNGLALGFGLLGLAGWG